MKIAREGKLFLSNSPTLRGRREPILKWLDLPGCFYGMIIQNDYWEITWAEATELIGVQSEAGKSPAKKSRC